MYICICKAVTDSQIREAISRGARTRKELAQCLRVGRDCGKCNPELRELLHLHAPLASAQQPPAQRSCQQLAA